MTYEVHYETAPEDLVARNREILNLLWQHDCEVTFVKVNGELRTMPCTLRKEAMPARDADKLTETKTFKPETISVWCLDKSEWRAFKVANVRHIRVIN